MYKVILASCLVLAAAQDWGQTELGFEGRPEDPYNFIDFYKKQYAKYLEDCDSKLDNFRKSYESRLNVIFVNLEFATKNIELIEERLTPLELLGPSQKDCVSNHRQFIPNISHVRNETNKCIAKATTQADDLCAKPEKIRNELNEHYRNFDESVSKCSEENYMQCVNQLIEEANLFSIAKQKEFQYELEAAECTAKVNVKRSTDCAFDVQHSTVSDTSTADHLVKECLVKKDGCNNTCQYHCEEISEVIEYEGGKTMYNPFKNANESTKCVLLKNNKKFANEYPPAITEQRLL